MITLLTAWRLAMNIMMGAGHPVLTINIMMGAGHPVLTMNIIMGAGHPVLARDETTARSVAMTQSVVGVMSFVQSAL